MPGQDQVLAQVVVQPAQLLQIGLGLPGARLHQDAQAAVLLPLPAQGPPRQQQPPCQRRQRRPQRCGEDPAPPHHC